MDEEVGNASLESALGAAFSDAPIAPKAPVAPQKPVQQAKPVVESLDAPVEEEALDAPLLGPEADPAELLAGEPEEVKPEAAEPSFEVEIDGKPEVITGSERVKELLARGLKAGRGFEENARVREALQAHVQQAQFQQQFQQAVSEDIAQVQALDKQLEAYGKIDWSTAYDSDPFNALKLKEQRDQLREQRAAAFQNLNAKQQQFQAHMEQGAQKLLAAESEALLAKVPAWRNAEKAAQEKGEIGSALLSHYGFTQAEVGQIRDHRMLLVARDAAAYRKLLANKDARVKQAREAPATAKPGAASAQPNGRVEFTKVRGKIRELGTKGNHRAQENLAIQMFERAFK
jgi:hypothetical protein